MTKTAERDNLVESFKEGAQTSRSNPLSPQPSESKAAAAQDDVSILAKADHDRPVLAVLGTGFASCSLLRKIDCALYRVVVISPRNYFLFTPLLHSSTVGTVELRSIIEPIRRWRACAEYFQAECVAIDSGKNLLTCESIDSGRRFTIAYDFLVIGTGAVNNTYGIPGVAEHALFLKELPDARKIRQRVLAQFERATVPGVTEAEKRVLLSFVIVGGGPTGVEFAAELHDLIEEDIRKAYPALFRFVTITLLEASDRILSAFDRNLAEYALALFERKNIRVIRGLPVTAVTRDEVALRDGSRVPFGVLVWSTGIGPSNLMQKLDFRKDKAERILTNGFLRVLGRNNVFAAGDCATIESRHLPATAQIAQQEGLYLAHQLNRAAKGRSVAEFHDRNMGLLAYIGSRRALLDLPKVKGKGFGAFLLWRSIYLTKLVSTRNKILVLLDWLKAMVFGRDLSNFS